MANQRKGLDDNDSSDSENNSDPESDSDSDNDIADSDDSSDADAPNTSGATNAEQDENEEEEDEVIKAIRRENERQRDHPPTIHCEVFIVDISFHPKEDILALANITGDAILYKYNVEENSVIKTLELHTDACRDIEFGPDGKVLYSVAKDKTIMLSDIETGKLVHYIADAHDVPAYCISVLDDNLFATGDDDGVVKVWDVRTKNKQILRMKRNEDYISDIISSEGQQYLLCASGDGVLTTIDLQNRKFLMQSEPYDEELTCLGLFRSETKLLAGSSKGNMYLFNWSEFGLHSDAFPGHKSSINGLVPITENIVVTACEDGNLRATHLFPHRHLGVVGQHELSAESVDICGNGTFVASCGHNDVKFWNIEYFGEYEQMGSKHNKHAKRKEMAFNLPSSKRRNVSDFFDGLA